MNEENEKYGIMLGQIGNYVSDWCGPHTTTLDGVKLVLAELYEMKAEKLRWEVEEAENDRMKP